jgi:hypothetical protein
MRPLRSSAESLPPQTKEAHAAQPRSLPRGRPHEAQAVFALFDALALGGMVSETQKEVWPTCSRPESNLKWISP